MNAKLLMPVAIVALLIVAGCGKKEEAVAPAAATPVTAPAMTAPAATPAMSASPTPEQAMQAIQAQAASLTPEQKQQTIVTARKTAEDAARAQGLSDDQIKQAADMAEAATKQMLGL